VWKRGYLCLIKKYVRYQIKFRNVGEEIVLCIAIKKNLEDVCVNVCCHRVTTQLQLTNITIYLINVTIIKKIYIEIKMCVLIFSITFFLKRFSHSK